MIQRLGDAVGGKEYSFHHSSHRPGHSYTHDMRMERVSQARPFLYTQHEDGKGQAVPIHTTRGWKESVNLPSKQG